MSGPKTLTSFARAKVNLTLRVLGRRADGFHELDSVVAFADVGDRVTFEPGAPAGLEVAGPFGHDIIGENLVVRALQLIAATAPDLTLGRVTLEKNLPVAAGLGGGSADAAAVLRLVRDANNGRAGRVDWMALSAQLGSDVSVCFADQACRMTGRGEILQVLDGFPRLFAVLANPQVPVPADKTTRVFEVLGSGPVEHLGLQARPAACGRDDWLALLAAGTNDLERPAATVIPAIANVLAAMRRHPLTTAARLSGAGPTCFALATTAEDARAIARDVVSRNPAWWVRAVTLG